MQTENEYLPPEQRLERRFEIITNKLSDSDFNKSELLQNFTNLLTDFPEKIIEFLDKTDLDDFKNLLPETEEGKQAQKKMLELLSENKNLSREATLSAFLVDFDQRDSEDEKISELLNLFDIKNKEELPDLNLDFERVEWVTDN